MLKLSKNVSLPESAITETFGIIAARGAGKSNTAAVMAEEMFDAELPFCVIDPVGAWWGLRSNRRGTGPGIPIAIFGGPKGDIPLERSGGVLVADIVVNERLSCVLDLRDFESEGAKRKFLLDFARRLYKRNETPLHLFLEEADDYIPQTIPRAEEGESAAIPGMLLRAWENIVRRGRARGLGMTMITQRSAVLNKNVLTQVQTLIAMRTTGPQDRKVIEDWLKYNDQSREILESLPSLGDGEAWIWSPQFLKRTVRTKFLRRRTFDSGSTPKMAAKSKTATLADIDISSLKDQMAETIKKVEADDPKILKRKIIELTRELKKKTPIEDPLLKEENTALRQAIIERDALIVDSRDRLHKISQIISVESEIEVSPPPSVRKITSQPTPKPPKAKRGNGVDADVLKQVGPRRCLVAIAQYPDGVVKNQLCALTQYAQRSVENHASRLRVFGMITEGWPALATQEGLDALGTNYTLLPTGDDLFQHWMQILPTGPRAVLDVVVARGTRGVEKSELIDETEYAARSVENHTSALKVRKLIEKRGTKFYAIEELF